jgi:hypothetical protein
MPVRPKTSPQMPLFAEEEAARSLLNQLFRDSLLYQTSEEFYELLRFIRRLRGFAPFNAMLLQVQKPGLQYAASRYDWKRRFNRHVKDGARPLVILWPFSPVAFVYDVVDTEGDALPIEATDPFRAFGDLKTDDILCFGHLLGRSGIQLRTIEFGAGLAGNVQRSEQEGLEVEFRSKEKKVKSSYIVRINKAHNPNVQFTTLVHELAHLYLGHLGPDKSLAIPERFISDGNTAELEAESVSFLVCSRRGVHSNAEQYLSDFVKNNAAVENLDIYVVLKAAGKVETVLGLAETPQFGPK